MRVRFKISDRTIMMFLFAIVLITKLQSRLATPIFDDDIILIFGAGGALLFWLFGSKSKINPQLFGMFVLLTVYALIYRFLLNNQILANYVNSYFLAFVAYLMIVFGFAGYFSEKNLALTICVVAYNIISIFLLICYMVYFDHFETFRNIRTFFFLQRQRSLFGFVQANTTADICLAAFALLFVQSILIKSEFLKIGKLQSRYNLISSIVIVVMLVSTASRGALLALFVMFGFYFYLTMEDKFKSKQAIRIIKPLFFFVVGIVFVVYIYISFIAEGRLDISYRLRNFTVNLPTLISNNRLWSGWGFVDKAVFANGRIISGTQYVDNYYLFVLVSTGIIGCLFVGLFLVVLTASIVKLYKKAYFTEYRYVFTVVLSILVEQYMFSVTQASFLFPSSMFSIITMIVFLSSISVEKKLAL
ncbi:MAG: hypothetical protein K6C08_11985 [Oscillospiraceae bacterium]|nr:hypothetical protein [Oscillospiraceae bacterium]